MSDTLRVVLMTGIILYFVIVFYLLKKQLLALKYTLLWLLTGILMGVLVIFPCMLEWLVAFMGIELPVNGLFAFSIGFIIVILMALTSIVSKQTERIRILVQQVALLEEEIRKIKEDYVQEE